MDVELVGRLAVGMSSVALLITGVTVLLFEKARARPEPVVRDASPLAVVNSVGILGFVGVGLGSAISMFGTVRSLPEPGDTVVRALGIAVLGVAGCLAIWGLRSIGRQMPSRAEVRPDTELVTGGAFGLVRHPLYLSILLLWAGGALALLSWAMAVCTFGLVPLFVARSAFEERLLIRHFGDDYRTYASRVPMLVPGWAQRRRHPDPRKRV